MKPAKCTQCGDSIIVDETKEAGICPSCGTAFVTEKVINNYVNNYNTVHNITENVTKIIMGNEKDEAPDFFKRGLTLLKLDNLASSHKEFCRAAELSPEKAEYWFYCAATEKKTRFSKYMSNFYRLADADEIKKFDGQQGVRLFPDLFSYMFNEYDESVASGEISGVVSYRLIPFFSYLETLTEEEKRKYCPTVVEYLKEAYIQRKGLFALPQIYDVFSPFMDENAKKQIFEARNAALNRKKDGVIVIADARLLTKNDVFSVTDDDVHAIEFSFDCNINEVKKILITPNIREISLSTSTRVPIVEIQEGTEFSKELLDRCLICGTELIIFPSGWAKRLSESKNDDFPSMPSAQILYCPTAANLSFNLIVALTPDYKQTEKIRSGYIADGKIIYPVATQQKITDDFDKLLLKYFDKEIKSGEISGYKPDKKAGKKGGCYVATCVYGSYDCPEVWTLRRYRDEKLDKTFLGRMFIKFYYSISPLAVKIFGRTKWFNKFFKARLDKMTAKLKAQGFSDEPYTDKY
jgi:cold-shock DNA-binding domain protein